MPLKTASAAAPTAACAPGRPLDGLVVAISGSFSAGRTHAVISNILEDLGATVTTSILPETTHLIASNSDAKRPSPKVQAALAQSQSVDGHLKSKVFVVGIGWLEECQARSARAEESPYLVAGADSAGRIDSASASSPPVTSTSSPAHSGLRRSARIASSSTSSRKISTSLTPKDASATATVNVQDSLSHHQTQDDPAIDNEDQESTPNKKRKMEKGASAAVTAGLPQNSSLADSPTSPGAVLTPPSGRALSQRATTAKIANTASALSQNSADGDINPTTSAASKKLSAKATAKADKNSSTSPVAVSIKGEDALPSTATKKSGQQAAAVTKEKTQKSVKIPLDEGCNSPGFEVYVDPDDGTIYDVSLNQTNSGHNNNKFYRIQIIHKNGVFYTWTRWGRVGERGQNKLLGTGTFQDAFKELQKKFKDKSGLHWDNRTDAPRVKKYVYIERNYAESSDEEDDGSESTPTKPGTDIKNQEQDTTNEPTVQVESKLHPSVQTLLSMIFDLTLFQSAFQDLNYDANKMPLGKLSKKTIQNGFQYLKALSELIIQVSATGSALYSSAIEEQSNLFYSQIPHDFGRNRPPVICTMQQLKKEVELLESLSDMKAANDIIRDAKQLHASGPQVHPLDQKYKLLNLDEMTPLDKGSSEYGMLTDYLINTRGKTHRMNFTVLDIFRVSRQGEADRFICPERFVKVTGSKSSSVITPNSNRRLLWHGSRCTNFGGILSQGLRIAPPEAPVSGYMFGKGVYLADMASKSANYCCSHISDDVGLLLLCEAELGDPMFELLDADFNAGKKAHEQGKLATWGKGREAPLAWMDASVVHESLKGVQMPDTKGAPPGPTGVLNAGLFYNEYICYDTSQIRLRYLFRVKMVY